MLYRLVLLFGLLFCIISQERLFASVPEASSESVAKEVPLHKDSSAPSLHDTADQQDTEEVLDKIEEDPDALQDWTEEALVEDGDEEKDSSEEEGEELEEEFQQVESESSKKPFRFLKDLFKK
jgi:hypothetical protein